MKYHHHLSKRMIKFSEENLTFHGDDSSNVAAFEDHQTAITNERLRFPDDVSTLNHPVTGNEDYSNNKKARISSYVKNVTDHDLLSDNSDKSNHKYHLKNFTTTRYQKSKSHYSQFSSFSCSISIPHIFFLIFIVLLLHLQSPNNAVNCQQPKPEDNEPPKQVPEATAAALDREFQAEPPKNVKLIECGGNSANIQWDPAINTDVSKYLILSHIQGKPDNDLEKLAEVPGDRTNFQVALKPGSNYTFKVATINHADFISKASESTELCSTPGDVPRHNPLNVVGKGSDPGNMVISWDPVPREAWNGPGFHYKVEYKPRDQQEWISATVDNPETTSYTVKDIKEFTPYDIKVTSVNDMGIAHDTPEVVVGFSGEDVPTGKPENVQLVEILNGSMARISWLPVKEEDFKGPPEGYKVKVTANDKTKDVKVPPRTDNAIINILTPNTENVVRVAAYNRKFDGPESDEIVINTPESAPSPPHHFKGYPLGPHSLRFTWKPPLNKNGKIIGYRVMYAETDEAGNPRDRDIEVPLINGVAQNEVFVTGLKPNTNYRGSITAATSAGYGQPSTVTVRTTNIGVPDKPEFDVQVVNGGFNVTHRPSANPGAFFYLVYRKEGGKWFSTPMEVASGSRQIKNVSENTNYEIQMISVNGNQSSISDPQKVIVPLDRAPNTPFNVNVDRCDSKESIISWDVRPIDKSPITGFIIEHQQEESQEWKQLEGNHPANVEQFVITDLPAGKHRFRVIATNRQGNSSPSEPTELCEITKAEEEERARLSEDKVATDDKKGVAKPSGAISITFTTITAQFIALSSSVFLSLMITFAI